MNIYGTILIVGFFLLSALFFGSIVLKPLYQYWKYGRANGSDLQNASFFIMVSGVVTTLMLGGYTIIDGNLLSLAGTVAGGVLLYRALNLMYSDATLVDFAWEKLIQDMDAHTEVLLETIKLQQEFADSFEKEIKQAMHKNAHLN